MISPVVSEARPLLTDVTERPGQSYWSQSWERLRANRIGMACGALILVLAAIALAAPLISTSLTHFAYSDQDLTHIFRPPSATHWLGTDELGRDTLTRLVYGARISLTVGFLTVGLSLAAGATVGLIAGYYGGWGDNVLMRL